MLIYEWNSKIYPKHGSRFDELANPAFTSRYSSRELYADAMSTLFNDRRSSKRKHQLSLRNFLLTLKKKRKSEKNLTRRGICSILGDDELFKAATKK